MQLLARVEAALLAQRGMWAQWAPVALALGISGYFALKSEPGPLAYAVLVGGALVLMLIALRGRPSLRPVFLGLALILFGALWAGLKAHSVAGPVLGFRYYGPIEGRVIAVDRSASDAVRLTLDRVVMEDMSPARTPLRVRVSLHGPVFVDPVPGQRVMMTGHLSPPAGPVEPGGFDFRRMAWFDRLGAVGYTRTPVLLAAQAQGGAALLVHRARAALSSAVQEALPGETGAFAAAITTGDRSGMGQETLEDLRRSNLAHLLAISGLHMGLLTGFVLLSVRFGLALWPRVSLRYPTKKWAALVALLAGAIYLLLSGGNVPTERAFIMVAVMLVAVLLDRRALTLRAVAIAALIVLILRPDALSGPGFQMSFAATTALVFVFGWMRDARVMSRLPKWARPVLAVFVSSLVAGLATAPFSAAHFNQVSHYGLIANVLSVPVMGTLVMPAAVLAAVLAPFGLAQVGLWLMDLGLRWILWVAGWVSEMEGAVSHVVAPPLWVLGALSFGALLLVLWRGRARWVGLAPIALAIAVWVQVERPVLLVADSGALWSLMGPDGRDLSKPRGDGFAADAWLENDGAPVPQEVAAARTGIEEEGRTSWTEIAGRKVLAVRGTQALAAISGCGGADILISNQDAGPGRPCVTLDIRYLRENGAVAGHLVDGELQLVTVRDVTGSRLWNGAETPPPLGTALQLALGQGQGAGQ